MVSATKFYIYGGGRWRELDLSDGRVEGWGRANFVYAKRGKVQVAKTGAVITALRDMVAGRNSAVKDGSHLPQKKNEKGKKEEKKNHSSVCKHSHCCHSKNNCQPTNMTNATVKCSATKSISKADAGIQTTLQSQTLTFPETFKQTSQNRLRESTSSDEKNAVVQKSPQQKLSLKRKRLITISSEENTVEPSKKKIPNLKLHKADSTKYNLYRRKRTKSSDSVVWVVLPKNDKKRSEKIAKYLKPKRTQTKSKHLDVDSKQPETIKRNSDQASKRTNPEKGTENPITSDKQDVRPKSNSQPLRDDNTKQDQCKELIIDEQDVVVLRNYLLRHVSSFDLLKFDQDDDYKKHFFFKINPLVSVERCPKIARILRGGSQDEISLKDFASRLGLRSISEKSPPSKNYKMRKQQQKTYKGSVSEDSDTDKENFERGVRQKNIRTSVNVDDASIANTLTNKNKGSSNAISKGCSTDSDTESENEIDLKRSSTLNKSKMSGRHVKDTDKLTSKDKRNSNVKASSKIYSTDSDTDTVDIFQKPDRLNKSKKSERYLKDTDKLTSKDKRNSNVKTTSKRSLIDSDADTVVISKNSDRLNKSKESERYVKDTDKLTSKDKRNINVKAASKRSVIDSDADTVDIYKKSDGLNKSKQSKRHVKDTDILSIDKTNGSVNALSKRYSTDSDTDNIFEKSDRWNKSKEKNVSKQNNEKKNKNNVTTETSTEHKENKVNEKEDRFKKPVVGEVKTLAVVPKKKTGSRPPFREYSGLEDHAIVTWVSAGGRASCVNGNRMWMEFQDQYQSITGQTRSWHSIRNRYLRYILPALGSMALHASQVARLRAAAATGEIKSRHKPGRRNSIFGSTTRGALSRLPARAASASERDSSDSDARPAKRHRHDNTRKATPQSPKRVLRSSLPTSPQTSRRSPRYSEITRHFTVTHQEDSTPTPSPTQKSKKSLRNEERKTQESKRQESERTQESTSQKSEKRQESERSQKSSATKSSPLRRSFRNKSPEKGTKTRKLFNPGSML